MAGGTRHASTRRVDYRFADHFRCTANVALFALLSVIDFSYLSQLSEGWAYITLGVSSILTEELAPLLGGFAAEQGHLEFTRVVMACAIGVFVLSAVLYAVGRWRAAWVRLKLRKSPPVVKKLLRAMRWSPWRSTILARVAFGGRIALPLACGAARVPPWIFFTGTAVASVAWALLLAGLGWAFGEGAVFVLGEIRKYEGWLILFLVALGVGGYLWLRKHQRAATAREAERTSLPPDLLP